jgi:hypothetical protein
LQDAVELDETPGIKDAPASDLEVPRLLSLSPSCL